MINTRLYEHTTFNARSIYVTIDTVDISKQSINSEGFVKIEGLKVKYTCYSAGLALGHQISEKIVTQTVVSSLSTPVTIENYQNIFLRRFRLESEGSKDTQSQTAYFLNTF